MTQRSWPVRPTFTGAFVLLLLLLGGVAGRAQAAVSAPAWSVSALSAPTVQYRPGEGPAVEFTDLVTATNVGGAATEGTVTLSDVLPAGITFAPRPPAARNRESLEPSGPITCEVTGQRVECLGQEGVQPGESIFLEIPVEVSPTAPSQVVSEIEISGGEAPAVKRSMVTKIGPETPLPGFLEGESGLVANATNAAGAGADEAGGHPYQATFDIKFPTVVEDENLYGVSEPKVVDTTLPRGMYANPQATLKRCTEKEFAGFGTGCPFSTQVGVARITIRNLGTTAAPLVVPVFNLVPPPGSPAEFAFDVEQNVTVHLLGHVRSNGEYELAAGVSNAPSKLQLVRTQVSLWGSPTDPSHDEQRGEGLFGGCLRLRESAAKARNCSTQPLSTAFLTSPPDCSGNPLMVRGETASWEQPNLIDERIVPLTGPEGNAITTTGCNALRFAPTISAQPSTNMADAPTGLDFDLRQPQDLEYGGRTTAPLKNATVSLPEGVSLNPAAGNGLGACTESQIGYQPSEGKVRFSESPQTCPNPATIGSVEVTTPLLDHPLLGSIYVAEPYKNPFGSLLAIYLAVEDEQSGIISKLAGKVESNPVTGQITATFTENPELPLEDIRLHIFNGAGAALKTPLTCGTKTTTSDLTPWSTPEGADAIPADSFATSVAAGTGPCPTSEAAAPNSPGFSAGTVAPVAGAFSPFVLKLTRPDGSQHITGISTTLPEGLLGKLAGIPYCPEGAIALAKSREAPERGKVERGSPSCPAASEVGTVTVGAGAGPTPLYVSGHAYLAGPYKGAPLSLVIITPAVAGPFDLGNVVTRVALNVDPFSAQINAVSDPLPTIIEGIPLDIRSIDLRLDRPGFTLNPTSCGAKSIIGTATAQTGQVAPLNNRFQVGGCNQLKFKPKLKISLSGSTKRTGLPSLKAVVTYPKQGAYANIARAQVNLPHSEFLEQSNLNKTCTKPVLQEGKCPKSTIYGKVKAWSPLLDSPLEGPIYLVGGFGYKLPALVAELGGQIRVLLKGKVDSGPNRGIRNTFEAVPDAPVSRFVLQLKGGKKYGLLINSEDLCHKPQHAATRFTAQNGLVDQARSLVQNQCGSKRGKGAKPKHRN
jgi:uncharacterized repeat protein (TIGR01451 family)